jgi:hypothetical protein
MRKLGLLRLLTNPKVMGNDILHLAGTLEVYDRWLEDPRVELVAEPRATESKFRQSIVPLAPQAATKTIADCYLIGFAEAAGGQLVTFHRGLASAARSCKVPVTLLRAAPPY